MVTVTNRLKYRFQFFHHKWGAISGQEEQAPEKDEELFAVLRVAWSMFIPNFGWEVESFIFSMGQSNKHKNNQQHYFWWDYCEDRPCVLFISVGKVCDLWELCGPDHLMTYKFHVMFFLVLILLRECRSWNFDNMTGGSPKRCWALRSLQTWPGKVWKTWRKQTLDIFSGQSNLGMFHCRLHFLQSNPAIWW